MKTKLFEKYRYSLILLRELVVTEFKLRYQGSVLGYLWSLLKPLLLFAILYFVFVDFLKIGEGLPHWPVAMLLGIVLWTFFSEITNNGLNSIVSRGDVIRKINFPKYVIVLASSISALINLGFNLVVIILFMIFSGVTVSLTVLLLPLYIIGIFVFGIGIAFFLSAVYVRLRDMNYIWEIIMQALFYGSVVIYPISMVLERDPLIAKLLLLNPVADFIQGARNVLVSPANLTLADISHNVLLVTVPVIITIGVFILGALYFRRKSPGFAEEV